KQMGAEHYMESVILGDSAYQVQQGFLADANALRRAAAVSQPPTPSKTKLAPVAAAPAPAAPAAQAQAAAAPAAKAEEKPPEEKELLAQFLLENLQ
ncbi:MAG: hypothetical protein JST92_07970, partial [Deltaproteobacteria bacterium]|nr:hypothetical protein [Deltaproteobacteria bacterium]